MMRIIILVYDISKMAGSEHGVANLATWLAEKPGQDVTVMTANLEDGAPAYPLPAAVKLVELGLPRYPRDKARQVFWHRRALGLLRGAMIAVQGAVVIGSWSNLNILLGVLARRDRKNTYIGWENLSYDSIDAVRKALRLRAYRYLDRVVVLTEEDRARYEAKGLSNVAVVPVAYPFYPEVPSASEARRVVSVGRLEPQKGFDLLIDAIRRLGTSFGDWEFVINGRGSEEVKLKRMAEEAGVSSRVRFVPRTEDIVSLYKSGSIYAMTSRYEGFPMVLLEAMACGLPCVSFDCRTGPKEVIADGENGFLVSLGDTAGFAERLGRLMGDATLRRRMSDAARNLVQNYSPERVYAIWEKAIAGAMTGKVHEECQQQLKK